MTDARWSESAGTDPGAQWDDRSHFWRALQTRLPVGAGQVAGHPFVRVGTGPERVVIVPGLNDPLTRVTDTSLFAAVAAGYCARYAGLGRGDSRQARQVYMVSRPAERVVESIPELAAGYADVLEAIGPADLLGLSMGGFIAGRIAADRPELVDRLVFGLAASRLSDEGRAIVTRWLGWAGKGKWLPIYREAVDAVSLGRRRRALRLMTRGYDAVTDGPAHPRAFRAEATACLAHDGTNDLKAIEVPTLVIGADADPFFDAREYRETVASLPRGSLCLFSGIGHQAVLERRRAFDGAIRVHLSRRPSP